MGGPETSQGIVFAKAIEVAAAARTDGLTEEDVDNLRVQAEELLDNDEPLFLAVTGFCTSYMVSRGDRAAIAQAGAKLYEAALRATAPDPVDCQRKDIYG